MKTKGHKMNEKTQKRAIFFKKRPGILNYKFAGYFKTTQTTKKPRKFSLKNCFKKDIAACSKS